MLNGRSNPEKMLPKLKSNAPLTEGAFSQLTLMRARFQCANERLSCGSWGRENPEMLK
jgi:hypothetical protein